MGLAVPTAVMVATGKGAELGVLRELVASVDLIVESGATPAPALSEETQRLLATDASALDAELLDIYLTEADEVLATVDEHLRVLEHSPADREALLTVRRQFHTLKGSGRMVGLIELGELAWGVERIHNRLLEEDRRVTPAVLALRYDWLNNSVLILHNFSAQPLEVRFEETPESTAAAP